MKISKAAAGRDARCRRLGRMLRRPPTRRSLNSLRQRRQAERRQPQQSQQPQPQRRSASLSREESAAIQPLYRGGAGAGLGRPRPPPAGRAGRRAQRLTRAIVVGQLQLEIGRGTQNRADADRRRSTRCWPAAAPRADDRRPLLGDAGELRASSANNSPRPKRALTRFVELDPERSSTRLRQLAEVKIRLNKRPEALALYQRAASQRGEAGGQPARGASTAGALALAYRGAHAAAGARAGADAWCAPIRPRRTGATRWSSIAELGSRRGARSSTSAG